MFNYLFELFVLVPFIGLLWIGFIGICYVFIHLIKGDI